MKYFNFISILGASLLSTLSSFAGEGSGAGPAPHPLSVGFALVEPLEGSTGEADWIAKNIQATVLYNGGTFSEQSVTWDNGRKVQLLCGKFKSTADESRVLSRLMYLSDVPLDPTFPAGWRGDCRKNLPLIADAVRIVETQTCDTNDLVQEVKRSCQGDTFCSFRLPNAEVDKALLKQGWKRVPGTANFHRCK